VVQISKWVEQGIIKLFIDKNTLEQAQQALDYSQSGRAKGKIVVTVKQ
jgi:NADPH:quinone reductase-like Zn-dependent oxidoreductase